MTEKLTKDLIESHLMSFIEVHSEIQRDGVTRWAWVLSPMAPEPNSRLLEETEFDFRFQSFESARNFAFGWIRRNRPNFEKAAKRQALDGIRYRASINR